MPAPFAKSDFAFRVHCEYGQTTKLLQRRILFDGPPCPLRQDDRVLA
jgi:hypothetical protein